MAISVLAVALRQNRHYALSLISVFEDLPEAVWVENGITTITKVVGDLILRLLPRTPLWGLPYLPWYNAERLAKFRM